MKLQRGVFFSKLSNLKMRYALDNRLRLLLSIVYSAIIIISIMYNAIVLEGDALDISTLFSLICMLLIWMSKDHSETLIFAIAGESLFYSIKLIKTIRYIRYAFQYNYYSSVLFMWISIIVSLLFSAFIIYSLYHSIDSKVIKIVSICFCAFILVRRSLLIDFSASVWQVVFSVSSLVESILILMVFVFAKYENAGEKAFSRVESLIWAALSFALPIFHFILWIIAGNYLEGHSYGAPDKYGDYARGLYRSEVLSLNSIIPSLWIMVAVLIGVQITHNMLQKKCGDNVSCEPLLLEADSSFLRYFFDFFIVICIVGTMFSSCTYSMYK